MFDFTIRNLFLYFKDRMAVLLSFLAEFIIVVLYILFMRENLIESFSEVKNIELLMDTWMIAGILGITSVTTTMGAYGIMVDDKAKKIRRDFTVSPIRRFSLLGGYMGSAVVIGMFMSVFLFLLASLYILNRYQVRLAVGMGADFFMHLFLVTLSNSALVLFLISFLKSSNALASCCTILGALIGFLTGIYLPMGNLPKGVQNLVKAFPVSHAVVLFRRMLMESVIETNIGDEEMASFFKEYMGVIFTRGKETVTANDSRRFLAVTAIAFFVLSVLKMCQSEER